MLSKADWNGIVTWVFLSILALSLRLLPKVRLANPAFTTLFQISTRWNAFAAPAASNGYIFAKQMGGDADLYADTLTWQTNLCLIILPVWVFVLIGS